MTKEQVLLDFVTLINDIARYDNVNNPTFTFDSNLHGARIIYPAGASISGYAFRELQQRYAYANNKEPGIKITYVVSCDINQIKIDVHLA